MKISGAIFDLDGTLLDSMCIWETIGEDYLRSIGIEPCEGLNQKFKSMSLRQAACYYKRNCGVTLSIDEIIEGVNGMIEHYYRDEVIVKKGVPGFLERLKQNGARMCVATATDRHLVEHALLRSGIYDYFSEIFTCASVGHGKDEPHIYNAAWSFLSSRKCETVVFEDALYAAQTAKKAGFCVVGVYDKFESKQDALKLLTDFYIKDFTEAEELLL